MHRQRHHYCITNAADIAIFVAMAHRIFNRMAHCLCCYIDHCTFDKQAAGFLGREKLD